MLCLRVRAAIREMAARTSTPQTLVRKRSKGYAPRLVAIGKYPSDDEEVIVIDETGARPWRRRRGVYFH